MLREYEYQSRKHFADGRQHSSASTITSIKLYRDVLCGCMGVTASHDYGHVIRLCTLIMDYMSWRNDHHRRGSANEEMDVTYVYADMASIAEKIVPNQHERMMILTRVYDNASQFFEQQNYSSSHGDNGFARVDRSSLIGAMRLAMGESELTESFIKRFEKRSKSRRSEGSQRV
eukprot:scaffold164_cov212-Alexandrium_tamarense.AAC.17